MARAFYNFKIYRLQFPRTSPKTCSSWLGFTLPFKFIETKNVFLQFLTIFHRNPMYARYLAAPSVTRIPALYANMSKLFMVLKPMSLRNNVETFTPDPQPIPVNLEPMDRADRQNRNAPLKHFLTKEGITMLPQNKVKVCKSSQSKQRSPWWAPFHT